MERGEEFPGVTAEMTAIRDYPKPFGANAAHLLGYIGPITADELAEAEKQDGRRGSTYTSFDLVGRAGLEQVYDNVPAWPAGRQEARRRLCGERHRHRRRARPRPRQLPRHQHRRPRPARRRGPAEGRHRARAHPRRQRPGAVLPRARPVRRSSWRSTPVASSPWPATPTTTRRSGSAASPTSSTSGCSSEKARYPLINRAIAGEYAPASTFKIVGTAAAAAAGYSLNGPYLCSSSFTPPGSTQTFANYEAGMNEYMSLARALEVSCNTVFYRLAYDMYVNEGGLNAGPNAPEYLMNTARGFGYGQPTGHRPSGRARRSRPRPRVASAVLGGQQGLLLQLQGAGLPRGGQRPLPAAAVRGALRRRLPDASR